MEPIRLCYIGSKSLLGFDPDEGQVIHRPLHWKGPLKVILNPIAELFFFPQFNYTVIRERIIGKQDSNGNFSGCNGQLQRNQADAGLYTYYYPSFEPTIDVSHIISEQKLSIFSLYNKTTACNSMEIINSFTNFSWEVYVILVLACWFMACMIRRTSRRIRRQSYRTFDIALAHMSKELTFDIRKTFPRIISLNLSWLLFFIMTGFICLIKTDIVVVDKPSLIETYDDILNNLGRLTPQFSYFIDEFWDFKHGRPESKERQIWERIQGRKIQFPKKLIHRLTNLRFSKTVEIQESETSRLTGAFFCAMKIKHQLHKNKDLKDLYPWIAKDPSARKIQYGFVMRTGVNSHFRKRLLERLDRVVALGLHERVLRRVMEFLAVDFTDGLDRSQFRKCAESADGKLQMQDVGHNALTITNYRRVLHYLLLFLYICFIVLAVEVFARRKRRAKTIPLH